MVNRRFSQVATSDDDDDDDDLPIHQHWKLRKRKRMKLLEEEGEGEGVNHEIETGDQQQQPQEEEEAKKKKKKKEEEEDTKGKEVVLEEVPQEEAKPVGDPIRVSGKGRGRRRHYHSFEFDGILYTLEDPVLLVPFENDQKPYVAIIKDITQSCNGNIMMTGQWFYRPEEAEQQGGGNWQSQDTRELFYSFHRDEVPAESVMHKCVVHFVPLHKQLPKRKEHPGFIVQKVYDTVEKKLWMLTDKDYEDVKQQEIDELVQKTLQCIGELHDIETDEVPPDQEDLPNKRTKRTSPCDVLREDEGTPKSDQHLRPETAGNCINDASEYYHVLVNFNVLTGNTHRDKWLEKLLEHIHYMCRSDDSAERDGNRLQNGNSDENNNRCPDPANECQDNGQKALKSSKYFIWPDTAVPAIVALEKASHDALSSDFQKYNKKLRQLDYNLKNNALLARRLLNGELEPSKILNMTPNELKEASTAEEMEKKESDESQLMQMTDARCKRCSELKVGLRDIIHAGHGDRYQLACIGCGNSWFASSDEVSILTVDASASKKNLDTEPSTTDVEKNLSSPSEPEKPAHDINKTSEV